MHLEGLKDFSSSIHKLLEFNTYFEIKKSNEGYHFYPLHRTEFARYVTSVHQFAKEFSEEVAIHDITVMSNKEMAPLIEISEFLQKFLKKYEKVGSKGPWKEEMDEIGKYALSLSLGAKISVAELDKMDPEAKKFLLVNEFAKKSLFFRLPIRSTWDEGVLFPVEIQAKLFHQVPFKKMRREELKDFQGKKIGYRFYLGSHFLFQTDQELRLNENFSLLADGIAHYHRIKSSTLYRTLKQTPEDVESKNSIEIWKNLEKSQLSLVMKREDGSIFSIGILDDRFVSPDPKFLSRKERAKTIKYILPCTRDQINLLKKKIEDARFALSEKRNQLCLMEVVSAALGKPLAPKAPLMSRHRWIATLILPLGIIKRVFKKQNCTPSQFSELMKNPHHQYCLDVKKLKHLLENERGGQL